MKRNEGYVYVSAITCIAVCIGEFVALFVLGSFYPGFNHLKDTMSSLGASNSPVSNEISAWWVIMGLLFIFFGTGLRKAFSERGLFSRIASWLIILYGFGEGIGSGAFKADHIAGSLKTSAVVHDFLGGIGVTAVLILPLIMQKVITKNEMPGFSRMSKIVFIAGIVTVGLFLFRYSSDENNFFTVYKGLWQRLFMLNTYVYFSTIAFIMIKKYKKTKGISLKAQLFLISLTLVFISAGCRQTAEFPITDLHIHLKGDFTIEDAVRKSEAENIRYGIAVNCGLGFPVHNDSQIDSFLLRMKDYPQFYIGMQAEGREWVDLFSKESIEKFDYVFTDAMTFTDDKGRRNRIWLPDETFIDDEEEFINHLVKTLVTILNTEPIDIYVNATFLPAQMSERYDYFWTKERMDEVINALHTNNIALEINNRYQIPSADFIKRAKKAGVKFTVGTNNTDGNFSGAKYALDMIKVCKLAESDFWLPVKKERF